MAAKRRLHAATTPPRWSVKWHPKAIEEKQAIESVEERVAIDHVIAKLQVDGPALRSPHQSAVMGQGRAGLRELRPRQGRSRYRPIYRRVEETLFAILAVGPEAGIDRSGYSRAVRAAKQRLDRLGKKGERGGDE